MNKRLIFAFLIAALSVASAFAYPTPYYPANQYGNGYVFYRGPWGEHMVQGGYGYFPNYNGYYPYGYRTYGAMYSPWQIRTGDIYSGPHYYGPSTRLWYN